MKMRRNVVRLNWDHLVRLDEISEFASGALDREVSRAAVIRAALDEWLASRAGLSPGDVVESILSGIVKRGRLSFEEIAREKAAEREPARKRPLGRSRRSRGASRKSESASPEKADPQKLFDKLIDTHKEIRHKDS